MKSKSIELYDVALDAINDVFSDQSVSQSETKRNLQSLIDEIEIKMETLKEDEADDAID